MQESKLLQLQKMVAEDFDKAVQNPNTSKDEIDRIVKKQSLINDALEEQSVKDADYKDMMTAYSKSVRHQSFNDSNNMPKDEISNVMPSFEEALQQFIAKNK